MKYLYSYIVFLFLLPAYFIGLFIDKCKIEKILNIAKAVPIILCGILLVIEVKNIESIPLKRSSYYVKRECEMIEWNGISVYLPIENGYMGYYYIQQSVQTGVYSVMYIHNDFLQLFLDVGWLPALLFTAAIIKSIFCGKKPLYKRVILAVTALHCCFDFDLQFIAVFMLLLLFTDYGTGKEYFLKKSEAVGGISFLAAIVCVYFGISLALSHFGKYEAANYLYPFDTRTQTQLLINEKDTEKAGEIADGIISRNEYVPIAYTVKARQAYSAGNFTKVIEYKRQIFEKAPFAYEEYKEYCYMLITGITLYNRSGDTSSAQICLKELKSAAYSVHTAKDRLSNLGAKIKDQPETRLPDDIEEYLKSEVTTS